MGVSYMFGRKDVGGGVGEGWSQTRKMRLFGRVFCVFCVVGGGVGGGSPGHEKCAQPGAFFVCFMLWEVG